MTARFNSLLLLFALAQPLRAWEMPSLSPKTWFTLGCGVYSVGAFFCGYKLVKENIEYNRQIAEYTNEKVKIENKYDKKFRDLLDEIEKVNQSDSISVDGRITFLNFKKHVANKLFESNYFYPDKPLKVMEFELDSELSDYFRVNKRLIVESDTINDFDFSQRTNLIKDLRRLEVKNIEDWDESVKSCNNVRSYRIRYEPFTGINGKETLVEKTPKFDADRVREIDGLKKLNRRSDKAALSFIVVGAGLICLGATKLTSH